MEQKHEIVYFPFLEGPNSQRNSSLIIKRARLVDGFKGQDGKVRTEEQALLKVSRRLPEQNIFTADEAASVLSVSAEQTSIEEINLSEPNGEAAILLGAAAIHRSIEVTPG